LGARRAPPGAAAAALRIINESMKNSGRSSLARLSDN